MFNSAHDEFPYFKYNQDGFPTTDEQLVFVNSYTDECKSNMACKEILKNFGRDLTTEKLLIEGRAFALFIHLNSAIWAKNLVGKSKIKFSYMVSLDKLNKEKLKIFFT